MQKEPLVVKCRFDKAENELSEVELLSISAISMRWGRLKLLPAEKKEKKERITSYCQHSYCQHKLYASSLHRFLSILGLFPVTFSVFLFILLRFDSQSSLSH